MGTLLVNERMLETYLYARDHFLKPGGKMFPVRTMSDISAHVSPVVCLVIETQLRAHQFSRDPFLKPGG